MKRAFQISRPLKFLSTLLLIAFMALLWEGINGEYHHNLSNSTTPSQGDISLNFSTYQDNNAFAILPYTSKVLSLDFHWISNFIQVKLLIVSDCIDVSRTQFVNLLVGNICHILTSIHAPWFDFFFWFPSSVPLSFCVVVTLHVDSHPLKLI